MSASGSDGVRRASRLPLAAAISAGLVGAVVIALLAAVTFVLAPNREPGPPPGVVLDGPARRALDALPIRRGSGPLPADPAIDLTDPEAVARAYLVAAGSVVAADAGRTHLRAAAYAAPGSPPATVGTVVLDPPPAGQTRAAVVTALELVAVNRSTLRRGYLASISTATGSPGALTVIDDATAYVVLARQPDGRWLVVADTSDLPDGGHD
jgi:hypothetical protein